MKTITLLISVCLLSSIIVHSQESYDPDQMTSTLDVECEGNGWTLSVLRFYYRPNDPGYKIQLRYHATIHEFCGQARKNILQNTYSSNGLYNSSIVSRNGQVGDYCGRDNGWIIGLVYSINYPNQNPNAGRIFTTNLGHDSNIEGNIETVSDIIYAYNSIHGTNPPLSSCPTSICGTPNTDSDDKYDSKYGKVDKALIKKHKDFLDIGADPVKPSTQGEGKKGGGLVDKSKLNKKMGRNHGKPKTVEVKIGNSTYARQLELCAGNNNKCYQETGYDSCAELEKDVKAGKYEYPDGWKNVTCTENASGLILTNSTLKREKARVIKNRKRMIRN